MKKLLAALLTISIAFTPVGGFVFQDFDNTVSAKSYKSGKKSFNSGNNNSNFQNNKKDNTEDRVSNKAKNDQKQKGSVVKNNKGGFMKGILFGGLAGLLLGGLLTNMGPLGAIVGLLINVIAVVAIFVIIRKIYTLIKNKRKEENAWRN